MGMKTLTIGDFELGKTIGSGAFAKVKMGRHTRTGEEVAIKVFSKERIQKESMKQQILMEIGITRLLKHENVISVTDVFQTEKSLYLVMELVRGCELLQKLQDVEGKGFPEPETRGYFQQLIMGVHYCHNQGVIHRDLKPENILIDLNGKLKITDFGMASVHSTEKSVCGSPNYVAPEVLSEPSYEGVTADIWSCGVILYAMQSGLLPFDHADDDALFQMIVRGTYTMPESFSAGARQMVGMILVTAPSARASIDMIVQHPWFQEGFDPAKLQAAREPLQVDA
eukprot:TRINITY_DN18293_c0_g1_i1.p1 TRINITY_DN18293_c0_g1~~TRINITY_DN18293_c0_g1_i1.p1  ORF type:complete len:283 (+),score=74.70 TRINITY_DN18293_c0_g1_i1:50-898(+)